MAPRRPQERLKLALSHHAECYWPGVAGRVLPGLAHAKACDDDSDCRQGCTKRLLLERRLLIVSGHAQEWTHQGLVRKASSYSDHARHAACRDRKSAGPTCPPTDTIGFVRAILRVYACLRTCPLDITVSRIAFHRTSAERGRMDHIAGLNEALIHVPLVIRPPGGIEGQRVSGVVDIAWLFSLLKAIASSEPEALARWLAWIGDRGSVIREAHGNMVRYGLKLVGRAAINRRDLLEFRTRHEYPAFACVSCDWKLICHLGQREDELCNVTTDPTEAVNLV